MFQNANVCFTYYFIKFSFYDACKRKAGNTAKYLANNEFLGMQHCTALHSAFRILVLEDKKAEKLVESHL